MSTLNFRNGREDGVHCMAVKFYGGMATLSSLARWSLEQTCIDVGKREQSIVFLRTATATYETLTKDSFQSSQASCVACARCF